MTQRICSVEDCEKQARNRGWCPMHYERWRTKGTTELPPRPTMEERFWAKVNKTPTCWLWTGALTEGYGSIGLPGRGAGSMHAHRYAYELMVAAIPSGETIDHKCRNRACVNPSHLQAVPQRINAQNLGVRRDNKTGVRGVWFDTRRQAFTVRATVGGKTYWGGQFATLAEAEAAVIRLRNAVMINNRMDRSA